MLTVIGHKGILTCFLQVSEMQQPFRQQNNNIEVLYKVFGLTFSIVRVILTVYILLWLTFDDFYLSMRGTCTLGMIGLINLQKRKKKKKKITIL